MECVKCDSIAGCKEKLNCGGAHHHTFDPNECGKCPMNKDAKCVPVAEDKSEDLHEWADHLPDSPLVREIKAMTGGLSADRS